MLNQRYTAWLYLHCEYASLKLSFWNYVHTNSIKHFLRNIVAWDLHKQYHSMFLFRTLVYTNEGPSVLEWIFVLQLTWRHIWVEHLAQQTRCKAVFRNGEAVTRCIGVQYFEQGWLSWGHHLHAGHNTNTTHILFSYIINDVNSAIPIVSVLRFFGQI